MLKQNKKKLDMTRFNKTLAIIGGVKAGTKLTSEELQEIRSASRDLENQVVDFAKEDFSEANYAVYDIGNTLGCFEVFNVMGTSLAYVWFDDLGYIDIVSNTNTYDQRMS